MSIAELMQRATSKDPKAMFELAEAYYLGDRGVSSDDDKAFSLYKELETLTPDDGMVLYRLGKCYEFGVGVDKDTNMALEYYQKAVEKGSGIACKTLGEFYKIGRYVQRDISKCLEYLNMGSKLKTPGSDEAAIMLGDMYHSGDEVEKNDTKACDLYRIAADQGNSNAYYRLGMQTFNGWGVEADKVKGMEYWKKGAELNHWGCMYIIGVSYVEGRDLPKDVEKGLYWLEHSADRGLADARCYLGKVYLHGLHGVPQNEKKGIQHLKAAAYSDQGQQEAAMIYGDYLYSQNTNESLSEAVVLYQRAAELGEPAAYHRLGMFTYNGVGVEEDKAKGIEYWKKGAELGQGACMYIIGRIYIDGKELPQDIEQGLTLLEKAAEIGMPDAHYYLGNVYFEGHNGVPKDEAKALQHFKAAAEAGKVEAMARLGDYYWGKQKSADTEEAAKWYDLGADKGDPYCAHCAVLIHKIFAKISSTPSVKHSTPMGYEFCKDEWKKVSDCAQREIQILQREDFEERDEQLESARDSLAEARYEQAICYYEMKQYSEVLSAINGVKYRDSDLLYSLAHFMSVKGKGNDAFTNTFREVVSAFLKLKNDDQLTTEEEHLRAAAASTIAMGYSTGVPGVLPQNMRLVEETLRNTIAVLTDKDYIQLLNEQLAEYGFSAAAPIVKSPQKPVVDPPGQVPVEDPPKPAPSDDPPKPGPEDGGDGPGIKPLLYVLIGLAGLAVILLLILVLGKKDNGQNNMPVAAEPTIQVTESVEVTEIPEQDSDNEVASELTTYQMPTSILISHPWEYYGARKNYEYTSDGKPLSCEVEVEGCVYSVLFEYMGSDSIQTSSLFINDDQVCVGEYLYNSYGNVDKIVYTFFGEFEEASGEVLFNYEKEGSTYIVDISPNIVGEYYLLPEGFLEIPGIGSLSFGPFELRLEYQVNESGMIQQLSVHYKGNDTPYHKGWTVLYHTNGVPSLIDYEFSDENWNYQMEFDEDGVPTTYDGKPVESISSLHIEWLDFEESTFDKIIRKAGQEGLIVNFEYTEYQTDAQNAQTTRIRYSDNGEVLEEDVYQWATFTYENVATPFPFFYNRW